MISQKQKLREKYKAVRSRLSSAQRKSAALCIAQLVLLLPELARAKTVGIYLAKGPEVETLPILKKLLSLKKTVAAPRADLKRVRLNFFKIRGLKDCGKGAFDILEPRKSCPPVPAAKIDLLLVPGIAFDRKGQRIGYGKGFYDRFLKRAGRALTVGLAYHKTLVRAVPHDGKDVPVSVVITEKGLTRV